MLCCCCCSHDNSRNQVRGHRTGSCHSGVEEHPREKQKTNVVHAYVIADAMHASARKRKKIVSQPMLCQVHTCTYVSPLAPENPTTQLATKKHTRVSHYHTPRDAVRTRPLQQEPGLLRVVDAKIGSFISTFFSSQVPRGLAKKSCQYLPLLVIIVPYTTYFILG